MRIKELLLVVLLLLPGVPLWARVPDDELPDDTVHLRNVTVTTQSYRDLIPAQTLSGPRSSRPSEPQRGRRLRYFSGRKSKIMVALAA